MASNAARIVRPEKKTSSTNTTNLPSMPPGLNGLFAPKGTPRAVLAQLERACENAVQSDTFITPAKRMYAQIAYLGGAAFRARAIEDWRYKGELIRALDLRME